MGVGRLAEAPTHCANRLLYRQCSRSFAASGFLMHQHETAPRLCIKQHGFQKYASTEAGFTLLTKAGTGFALKGCASSSCLRLGMLLKSCPEPASWPTPALCLLKASRHCGACAAAECLQQQSFPIKDACQTFALILICQQLVGCLQWRNHCLKGQRAFELTVTV